jgi:hypothetical protein
LLKGINKNARNRVRCYGSVRERNLSVGLIVLWGATHNNIAEHFMVEIFILIIF